MFRALILVALCLALLLWGFQHRSNHYLYDTVHVLSPQQVLQYEKYCRSIEDKSGIAIILSTGTTPKKLSRPKMMEVHLQKNDVILLFSQDMQSAFTPLQQMVLLDGAKLMLAQNNQAEALEFVFLNFVEMIAHSKQISMTNLLESTQPIAQGYLLILLVLLIVLLTGVVYLFLKLGKSYAHMSVPATNCFGGSLGSKYTLFGDSIDSYAGR